LPRTLTIFFPDGTSEYWLTELVFQPGDKLQRNGGSWVVASVGRPEAYAGGTRHMTVTVGAEGDGPSG
jgi:hypothetical protein